MKKIISLALIGLTLSGCSLLSPHKLAIEQGNIITEENTSSLRRGMTEAQVRDIMGNPLIVNTFAPNRMDYVYTYQPGYGNRTETRISCIFQQGRLQEIRKN